MRWRHGIASLRRQVLVEEKTNTNVRPVRERLVSIVIAVGGVFKPEDLICQRNLGGITNRIGEASLRVSAEIFLAGKTESTSICIDEGLPVRTEGVGGVHPD